MSNIAKKFVFKFFKRGNKCLSEKVYLKLLRDLKLKHNIQNSKEFINNTVLEISTPVGIIAKKVGGTVYQIPIPIKKNKEISVSLGWLLDYIKTVKNLKAVDKIEKELLLINKNEGELIKKKVTLNKLIINNRAFLKFLG